VARHFFDWLADRLPGYAPGAVDYAVESDVFRVSPRSFFQVNRFLVAALAGAAIEGAAGNTAMELYAGAGLFAIPLARRFSSVTAVESGASALSDLKFNSDRGGVSVRAVRAPVEDFLLSVQETPDFVLADPPREGLGKRVVRELIRIGPPRIHIVACDPATLTRDLRHLLDGGYRIERITMADLFPQTYHLETIVALVRQPAIS
jgi:23S rRNA (uracil1939-C5)-methyltransferase